VFLIVFMWNLCKCKCWLIIEVIEYRVSRKVYLNTCMHFPPLINFNFLIFLYRANAGQHQQYNSVSHPPGRGPVPGLGINYNGPRDIMLELINN